MEVCAQNSILRWQQVGVEFLLLSEAQIVVGSQYLLELNAVQVKIAAVELFHAMFSDAHARLRHVRGELLPILWRQQNRLHFQQRSLWTLIYVVSDLKACSFLFVYFLYYCSCIVSLIEHLYILSYIIIIIIIIRSLFGVESI